MLIDNIESINSVSHLGVYIQYTLSDMLDTKSISGFKYFQISKCLYKHNEIFGTKKLKPTHKIHFCFLLYLTYIVSYK